MYLSCAVSTTLSPRFPELGRGGRGEWNSVRLDQIGKGNFSEVWEAVRRDDGKSFAIKIVDKKKQFKKNTSQDQVCVPSCFLPPDPPQTSPTHPHRPQLEREVNILKNLRHPNIVSIIDVFDDSDFFSFVLELAHGCAFCSLFQLRWCEFTTTFWLFLFLYSNVRHSFFFLSTKSNTMDSQFEEIVCIFFTMFFSKLFDKYVPI